MDSQPIPDNRNFCIRINHMILGLICVAFSSPTPVLLASDSPKSPLSPQKALEEFQLHPQLRIELVASEPEVVDPVAIRFDADGRMWVVEMRDYPNGPAKGERPKSRIKILEDADHDGRFEKVTVFADQLLFATGLQPWKGGVIVTLAGDVYWMKDTNGDGKADIREHWFTGFKEENPQLRANHPTFAYDNHIYLSSGIRGGSVTAVKEEWKKNAKPVSVSGRDFRFDPLTGKYEAISGNGQFGMTFDDFGNRFVCSNRNPCMHVVLEDRYIRRNPHLAVKSVVHDVSPAGASSRIYPISKFWTTSTLHEGQFTAACGVTIYRGDLLPGQFLGNSFTCDPTGNLVHRDVLSPMGATFTSKPGRDKVEFLATRDDWCRIVNLENGPDGALYAIDMYRAVIEHPQYMPDELKQRPDLTLGNDRGRIYRIVPKSSTKPRSSFELISKLSSTELAKLITHPNAWQREMAHRLLIERQDKSSVDQLEQMALGRSATPQGRIHALWALHGLGSLTTAIIRKVRFDTSSRVREHIVRLSEPLIRRGNLKIEGGVRRMADARERFQLALSLGEGGSETDVSVLREIAWPGKSDSWTRLAFFSSMPAPPVKDDGFTYMLLLTKLTLKLNAKLEQPGTNEFFHELFALIGSRADEEELQFARLHTLIVPANASPSEQRLILESLVGLCRGLARRGKKIQPFTSKAPMQKTTFELALSVAESPDNDVAYRLLAIEALRFASSDSAAKSLLRLSTAQGNQRIQLEAIRAVSASKNPEVGTVLLRDFPAATPVVRRAILNAVLSTTDRAKLLLDEIEAKRITVPELGISNVNRLAKHRDTAIRQRAQKLLADAIPADRKKVLKDYQSVLTLRSDPKHGREIFRKNCAACHRIDNIGVDVAPDIADSRTKKPEQLLVSILDPNRAIDNNYFSYNIVTSAGKVETGIIASETSSSITLRQQENKTVTILRQDIEEMKSNGVSLMPVGLEKNINKQQMADLISFIKNWRYLNGRVPIKVGQ